MCFESCQTSWVEGKELVDLSVSSNRCKMLAFRTVLKLNEVFCDIDLKPRPCILFLSISLLPILSTPWGPKLLTCDWKLGSPSWWSRCSRILVNFVLFPVFSFLRHCWRRLSHRPSAVSLGCWICSPPLSKLAESNLEATQRIFWTDSDSIVRVQRKVRISL